MPRQRPGKVQKKPRESSEKAQKSTANSTFENVPNRSRTNSSRAMLFDTIHRSMVFAHQQRHWKLAQQISHQRLIA